MAMPPGHRPSPESDAGVVLAPVVGPGLDILFVGINPGLRSARSGHHFAGPGNHFWHLLADAGLTPGVLTPEEDGRVVSLGLGIANLIDRPSAGEADLAWSEFVTGAVRLRAQIEVWHPRVVALLGKSTGRAYLDLPPGRPLPFGPIPSVGPPRVYVLPNPSARSTIRYAERLRLFAELTRALHPTAPKPPRTGGCVPRGL